MEIKKVAISCLAGGLLFFVISLILVSQYWWLGILAGVVCGYLVRKFDSTKIILVVLTTSIAGKEVIINFLKGYFQEFVPLGKLLKSHFSLPQPFFWPGFIVLFPLYLWILIFYIAPVWIRTWTVVEVNILVKLILTYILFILSLIALVGLFSIINGPLRLLASIGARFGESCYWLPFELTGEDEEEKRKRFVTEMKEKGYYEMPLTYTNAIRWIGKGFLIIINFVIFGLLGGLICFQFSRNIFMIVFGILVASVFLGSLNYNLWLKKIIRRRRT